MAESEIVRSVLPYRWSSNDRYQLVHRDGSIGFAFKPRATGKQYVFGSILCFGLICPAFFIGFWFLTKETMWVALIGGTTCALGLVLGWVQWKWDVRRQKKGPLWAFDTASGMFHNSCSGVMFHRNQLRAIQFLKFKCEFNLVQLNFVVNQPDGQLPKRHVIRTVGDWGWDNGQSVIQDFLRETGCAEVPILYHKEARGYDLGYALVDWIKGKNK